MLAISTAGHQSPDSYIASILKKGLYHYELLPGHAMRFHPKKVTNLAMPLPGKKYDELPSLASSLPDERARALAQLSDAIHAARHVKTPNLVIWPGYVDAGAKNIIADKTSEKAVKARKLQATASVQNLCRSLFEAWKQEPRIVFCIPPAQRYSGIPLLDELEWIIEDLPQLEIRYWHNTAHAFFQEELGLAEANAWLERYGKIMAGIHFEDVLENEPLSPPGVGKVQFTGIRKYLSEKTIRVLRADSRFGPDEVWYSCQLLEKMRLL